MSRAEWRAGIGRLMANPAEILCSRCGTPFPQERGKTTVTCVVCGQLRPDLDMTLDDDEEDLASGMGAGVAGASLRPSPEADTHQEAPPVLSHLLIPQDTAPTDSTYRSERPFMPAHDTAMMAGPAEAPTDSLMDRLGPVLLIILPLGGGMAGALNMLQLVPDFSAGAWYAVGTVFVLILIATLLSGLMISGFLYLIRIRWTILLRATFVATAVGISYYSVVQLPRHIQVRANDLPGLVLRQVP